MDIFPGGHQKNIDVKRVDSKPRIYSPLSTQHVQ